MDKRQRERKRAIDKIASTFGCRIEGPIRSKKHMIWRLVGPRGIRKFPTAVSPSDHRTPKIEYARVKRLCAEVA